GRVGGLCVARMGGRVLTMEPGLDVREAPHDVTAALLEDGAAALLRMGRAGVREQLVDCRAREPQAFHRRSSRGRPTRVRARISRASVAFTGVGTPCAAPRAATCPLMASISVGRPRSMSWSIEERWAAVDGTRRP